MPCPLWFLVIGAAVFVASVIHAHWGWWKLRKKILAVVCPRCYGRGKVTVDCGMYVELHTCSICGGTGRRSDADKPEATT